MPRQGKATEIIGATMTELALSLAQMGPCWQTRVSWRQSEPGDFDTDATSSDHASDVPHRDVHVVHPLVRGALFRGWPATVDMAHIVRNLRFEAVVPNSPMDGGAIGKRVRVPHREFETATPGNGPDPVHPLPFTPSVRRHNFDLGIVASRER